jgi:hypothetical protein
MSMILSPPPAGKMSLSEYVISDLCSGSSGKVELVCSFWTFSAKSLAGEKNTMPYVIRKITITKALKGLDEFIY